MRPPLHTATNWTLSSLSLVVIFISQSDQLPVVSNPQCPTFHLRWAKSVKEERLTSERSPLMSQSAELKTLRNLQLLFSIFLSGETFTSSVYPALPDGLICICLSASYPASDCLHKTTMRLLQITASIVMGEWGVVSHFSAWVWYSSTKKLKFKLDVS